MSMMQKIAAGITLYDTDSSLQDVEEKILSPINFFKDIVMSVIAAAGVLILVLGLVDLIGEFSSQRKDITSIMSAVFKILGGVFMIFIGAIVIFFTT